MQRSSRSFRGNASPTSSHAYGRRMEAQHAALEDWETSFTQILSRTKQNIIRVNERYGSPSHGGHPMSSAPLAVAPSRVRDSMEYLGIAPLRSHRVGTEPSHDHQHHQLQQQQEMSPLLQRLERLEASVLQQTQAQTYHGGGGEPEMKAFADNGYGPATPTRSAAAVTSSLAPRDTALDRRVAGLENKVEQVNPRAAALASLSWHASM